MDNDERQKFLEHGAKLIDSINRLMLFIALLIFYFLITPILYDIQKSTQKTAETAKQNNATLEAIREKIGEEAWQRNEQRLKQNLQNTK